VAFRLRSLRLAELSAPVREMVIAHVGDRTAGASRQHTSPDLLGAKVVRRGFRNSYFLRHCLGLILRDRPCGSIFWVTGKEEA